MTPCVQPGTFGRLVFALDARLRLRQAVIDFAGGHLLRIQVVSAGGQGDRVVNIHWRNESLRRCAGCGEFRRARARARALEREFEASLRALAACLAASPEFDDVVAIRGVAAWSRSQSLDRVPRVAAAFGFSAIPERPPRRLKARLRREGENVLVLLLVLACNPRAASWRHLSCGRIVLLMPR
jgi:hypothetical protein